MQLLVNENIPATVIAELRTRGHDVFSVKESMRGASDTDILAHAQGESRVRRIVAVVESRIDWSGVFAVATDKRVRVRSLPPPA